MTIEGIDLRWNSTAKDWINSKNAINEVGSIHTVFGNDLNYIAIVFGKGIDYDPIAKTIVVYRDEYKDTNGKNSTDDFDLLFYVKNIYKTLMFRGIRGVYIYVCNPNLKAYLSQHMEVVTGNSENESQVIPSCRISSEPTAGSIPYYDLEIAAGSFSKLQQSETLQYIEVEGRYQDPKRYFACKVIGESMNKIISNGSICLFERYQGGSRNGLICLVESSSFKDRDFGANYTIKSIPVKSTITSSQRGGMAIDLIFLSLIISIRSFNPASI